MQNSKSPLHKTRIASPCAADWTEMIGDDRRRFCGDCKLNVYNLSGMTEKEAEKLLVESEGNICVRFYRRTDGTILTQDCPVGWAKIKRRVSKIATAAFSLIAGFFGGIFSLSPIMTINEADFQIVKVENTDETTNTKDQHEIILDTDEMSLEEPSFPMLYVGKIDPTAYSHFRKSRER